MATRLYLVATTAASVSPAFDAGWPSTADAVRRTLATTQAAATETLSGTLTGAAGNYSLAVQLISPPLSGAQTISGTWNAVTRGRELAAQDNINKRGRGVRVFSSAGVLRGTVVAWGASGPTTELSTTAAGQSHAVNSALSSVAAQDGDYLVVELGYGESSTGTTPNWEMVLGGSGTDHTNADNDTTGTVPWIEFSANLTFQSGTVTGVLAGTLPALSAGMAGTVTDGTTTGTLTGTLPALTADVAGQVEVAGTVAGTLPALTADLAGNVTVTAALTGTLPAITAGLVGSVDNLEPGTLTAVLPAITAGVAGEVTAAGSLAAVLPALTGALAGELTATGALGAVLPVLTGDLAAAVLGVAVKATSTPTLTAGSAGTTTTTARRASTATAAGGTSTPTLTARRTSTPEVTRG